jgi:hypothetical protein
MSFSDGLIYIFKLLDVIQHIMHFKELLVQN